MSPTNGPTNGTNPLKTGPHPAAIAFAELMLPEHHREITLENLKARNLSTLPFLLATLGAMASIVAGNLPDRTAIHPALLCVDAAALAMTFVLTGQPMGQPVYFAVAAGVLGLLLCNVYVFPTLSDPIDQGVYSWVAIIFILIEQGFAELFAPAGVLRTGVMLQGFALGILTVSMIRMIVHPAPIPEEGPAEMGKLAPSSKAGQAPFKRAFVITLTWLVAAYVLLVANPLPEFAAHQGFWHPVFFTLSICTAFRLQKDRIGGLFAGAFTTILQDPVALAHAELERMHNRTFSPPASRPAQFPWPTFFEILSYAIYCLPLAVGLLALSTMDGIDRLAYVAYFEASLSLAVLWVFVRRMNLRMGAALESAMATLATTRTLP